MLRIAVPNKGSLSDATVEMLREAGYRQRRDSRELHRQVRRESLLLRGGNDPAQGFALDPSIWIIHVRSLDTRRRKEPFGVVPDALEGVHERAQVVRRHAPSPLRRARSGAFDQ